MLSELIADHLGTHDELQSGRTVEVPFITGSFAPLPPDEISVTVWLRKLVRESALQPGTADAARLALDNVGDKQGEAWSAAARRLVLLYRAFTVDAEMPHASEEVYFWRYISERQLHDLLERALKLLLPSALDQSSLQAIMHQQVFRVTQELRPIRVETQDPHGDL